MIVAIAGATNVAPGGALLPSLGGMHCCAFGEDENYVVLRRLFSRKREVRAVPTLRRGFSRPAIAPRYVLTRSVAWQVQAMRVACANTDGVSAFVRRRWRDFGLMRGARGAVNCVSVRIGRTSSLRWRGP